MEIPSLWFSLQSLHGHACRFNGDGVEGQTRAQFDGDLSVCVEEKIVPGVKGGELSLGVYAESPDIIHSMVHMEIEEFMQRGREIRADYGGYGWSSESV